MFDPIDPLDGYTPRWRAPESPIYDELVAALALPAGPITTALSLPLVGRIVNR